MQKQGQRQAEQRRKVRFLESALEGEEEEGQLGTELGQAHTSTAIQAQRRGGGAKLGRRGVCPPRCSSAPISHTPTAINAVEAVRGWIL
jgi:hypothetical protein